MTTDLQEQTDIVFREHQLSFRIEYHTAIWRNARLAGDADAVRTEGNIIEGLANQYFSAFKTHYVSVEARRTNNGD